MSGVAQFTILIDGVAAPIAAGASVNVQVYSIDGSTALTTSRAVTSSEGGANWAEGVVGVAFQPQEINAMVPPAVMVVLVGPNFVKRFSLDVQAPNVVVRSQLFIQDFAITAMRQNNLVLLAQSILPGFTLTDDYIWQKVVAAESETGTELRVPLVPTQFYATAPTPQQLAELPTGMPWAIDPAQDYEPDFFQGEKWGYIVLRNKPVISVQSVAFVYPSPTTGFFTFPNDWIRLDQKYGQLRFVPASSTFVAPLNAFLLQALGGGRTIPFAFQITYQAGITNAAQTYPQLLDVILRRAALKIVEDAFLPSSGSISVDGLSQSLSINMEQYRDVIQTTLFGPKGRNGGLMTAIHGIKMAMLGN